MNDFDELNNVIGPECTIAFAVASKKQMEELTALLATGPNNDVLVEWFQRGFSARACNGLDAYVKIRKAVTGKIRVVEESPPWITVENDEVAIGISLNICHEDHDCDGLYDALYDEAFDRFICRELVEIIVSLLKEKLPWLIAENCNASIDSIGQN